MYKRDKRLYIRRYREQQFELFTLVYTRGRTGQSGTTRYVRLAEGPLSVQDGDGPALRYYRLLGHPHSQYPKLVRRGNSTRVHVPG